ncbi:MAG: SDR family NAD(P)-dependent oxidoreductase [Pseudomonadota bacterium]
MERLHQEVVMVSGANRGIGGAIARLLHDAGYRMTLGVRDPKARDRMKDSFDPDRCLIAPYEAGDRQSPVDWVAATIDRFGRLDAMVNAAGILRTHDFRDEDETALDQMWEINVKGPMRLMRAAYPHLKERGAGRIVNLASLAGLRAVGNSSGYAMSKFAVVALTDSARQTGWSDGVRATAICPGYVNTDMVAEVQIPAKADMIQPDEIARVVKMVIEMPNNASIARVPINCRNEPLY